MHGGIGVSAPSLHRESTDSLINVNKHNIIQITIYVWVTLCRYLLCMAYTYKKDNLYKRLASKL